MPCYDSVSDTTSGPMQGLPRCRRCEAGCSQGPSPLEQAAALLGDALVRVEQVLGGRPVVLVPPGPSQHLELVMPAPGWESAACAWGPAGLLALQLCTLCHLCYPRTAGPACYPVSGHAAASLTMKSSCSCSPEAGSLLGLCSSRARVRPRSASPAQQPCQHGTPSLRATTALPAPSHQPAALLHDRVAARAPLNPEP